MSVFLCHASRNSAFVIDVAKYLKPNLGKVFYYEDHQRADEAFNQRIQHELKKAATLVFFIDSDPLTVWQQKEVEIADRLNTEDRQNGRTRKYFIVRIPGANRAAPVLPTELMWAGGFPMLDASGKGRAAAIEVASDIVKKIPRPWYSADDLPLDPHLFSYEKDVTKFFIERVQLGPELFEKGKTQQAERRRRDMRKKLLNGCPAEWPSLTHWTREDPICNLLDERTIGKFRPEGAQVLTGALFTADAPREGDQKTALIEPRLSFKEAGPREHLYFPEEKKGLRVAILVSGGIAPGINAVIDGITQRHWLYAERHNYEGHLEVYGLQNGFHAFDDFNHSRRLLAANANQYPQNSPLETSDHANEGGSILGTSRVEELLKQPHARVGRFIRFCRELENNGIDILYIIGGDGSMKAAHALWSIAQERFKHKSRRGRRLSVIAIPKTMDNDVLWVWQSFGFLSAVEKAREFIEQLHTEVSSNPRLCVAQLFGSDSGYVVSHAVLASGTGHCDAALIPEVPFSLRSLAQYLKTRMCKRGQLIPHGLVVMAETAIPTDALELVDHGPQQIKEAISLNPAEMKAIRRYDKLRRRGRRIEGQTDDALRTAGLKIVLGGLSRLLPDPEIQTGVAFAPNWKLLRVFANEPRHLLRAIPPSCTDIIMGHRLGTLAVDNAMAGYTDFMISQWMTEYVLVPLKLVVLGRKRIPHTGIFWKSVLAKTGQTDLQ